jgi:hypothetical protein
MRFPRSHYRGIAPLTAAGSKMSRREYERWRDAHTWDPSRGTQLAIHADLGPASWLEPRLQQDAPATLAMLPGGFDAYALIFHPFDGETSADRRERIAAAVTEPGAEILRGPGGQGDPQDHCGFLPDSTFDSLVPILARYTSSSDSWFLLWDGFGTLNDRAFSHAPKVKHPDRDMYLLGGPHRAYLNFPESPNYWWPGDRAWCVCTDTDWVWYYIAGSAACVTEILAACVR